MASDTCEMDGCTAKAVGYVEAQWSIVDFVRYETCADHMDDMLDGLSARRVEGWLPSLNYDTYDPQRDWRGRPL